MTPRRILLGTAGALVLGVSLSAWAGLRINTTESMPVGIWCVRGLAAPRRGDVAAVCLPAALLGEGLARGYVGAGRCPGGSEPLLKPIAAVAGDMVTVTPAGLAVNGVPLPASAALAADEAGRPLRPVARGSYRVRPGEAWLISSHSARSFDSRYFGPVPTSALVGEAHPVWVLR